MWREAIEHVVGCWTNERYSFEGKHWSLPDRRVQPKPLQQPHPPIWGATTSDDGHAAGRRARPRAVLVRGRRVARGREEEDRHLPRRRSRSARRRSASSSTTRPRRSRWRCARRPRTRRATSARESFEWYPKVGARQIAQVAEWMEERKQALGNYDYAADMQRALRRRLARPAVARVPRRHRRVRARHARPVPRRVQALRSRRRRPAALPREPVQDRPRAGDADHRPHGQARHPELQLTGSA